MTHDAAIELLRKKERLLNYPELWDTQSFDSAYLGAIELSICPVCSALARHPNTHAEWHLAQLPPIAEEARGAGAPETTVKVASKPVEGGTVV